MEWEEANGSEPGFAEFVRRGLVVRAGPGIDVTSWVAHLETMRSGGHLVGVRRPKGGSLGALALYDPAPRIGARIHLLYAEGRWATAPVYTELLAEVHQRAGEVAFLPGPLAGLTAAEEERLLTSEGFARYGRSEMVFPPEAPVPSPRPGPTPRPLRPEDEPALAELHQRAYHGRFDRYLFLEDPDEARDAVREVHEILTGRWGPWSTEGSVGLEENGRFLASVLVVQQPDRALIADVAVDPQMQGRGLGRAVLLESVRRLRASGVRQVFLNVTEGNERALRLYLGLGFVRSLGPSQDWYQTRRIPVPP